MIDAAGDDHALVGHIVAIGEQQRRAIEVGSAATSRQYQRHPGNMIPNFVAARGGRWG